MTAIRLEPCFIDSSAGRIFVLLRAPAEAKRCVLCVPAFGEEMNKSRAQVTATANLLNERGVAVVVVDLFGTGDSEGGFSDASWSTWTDDIEAAAIWAEGLGYKVGGILAIRLGCALAADSLRKSRRSVGCSVFWQPVAGGAQFMTQFLRLRVAASMMQSGGGETVEELKKRITDGETLEVAGYSITPKLFGDIEQTRLAELASPFVGNLTFLELGRATGDLSPGLQRLQSSFAVSGVVSEGRRLAGEPFWSATEIVVNSELADATAVALATGGA